MVKKKESSLKINFIMNVILTMSSIIFPLITFPYVSRILQPEGTGKVSFATSVISYFALFAQLGIPTYGIRACAQVRDDREELTRTAQEIFVINLVMTVLAYTVFVVALLMVPRLQQDKALFLIVSTTLIFNTIGMEWLYKALEQYTYITVRSVIFKFIALVAMLLLVHEKSDYVMYGALSIFAASASNVLNFINVRKYINWNYIGNYDFKRHLKPILVFFAMSCATTIYTNLDTVMLGIMKTDVDVGYYNAAVKVKGALVSLVTSLGTVLLPRASYYVEHHMKSEFEHIMVKAINFVLLVATPLTVYFIVFAKESIFLLSGEAYVGSIVPMQIIMPTVLLIGLSNIMAIQILVPLGREKVVLHAEVAGAVIDFIINLLLIPTMASSGAAIGTLIAEVVVTLWTYVALRDTIIKAYRQVHYGALTLAILLGVSVSLWTKLMPWGNFAKLAISAILFFGMYLLVLTLAKEPLTVEIEKQLLGKFKEIKCSNL